jgi:hypothetical protein
MNPKFPSSQNILNSISNTHSRLMKISNDINIPNSMKLITTPHKWLIQIHTHSYGEIIHTLNILKEPYIGGKDLGSSSETDRDPINRSILCWTVFIWWDALSTNCSVDNFAFTSLDDKFAPTLELASFPPLTTTHISSWSNSLGASCNTHTAPSLVEVGLRAQNAIWIFRAPRGINFNTFKVNFFFTVHNYFQGRSYHVIATAVAAVEDLVLGFSLSSCSLPSSVFMVRHMNNPDANQILKQ